MRFLEYHEQRRHGSQSFPIAIYPVFEHHPRYNMPYHWHHEYEIIQVHKGHFRLRVDHREYLLREGDSALIFSGALHGGTPDHCEYSCIVFNLDEFIRTLPWASELKDRLLSNELVFPVYLPREETTLQTSISQLSKALLSQPSGYQFLVLSSLYSLIGTLLSRDVTHTKKDNTANRKRLSQLKTVLSYISQHYPEDITLQNLADSAGMNAKYFCRFFFEIMHRTPMDYLNYYRIESACEQLAATSKSITEIAFDCGYHDTSYFVKVFRKYQELTPSQYRKKQL